MPKNSIAGFRDFPSLTTSPMGLCADCGQLGPSLRGPVPGQGTLVASGQRSSA